MLKNCDKVVIEVADLKIQKHENMLALKLSEL